jgi:hypothetical protein
MIQSFRSYELPFGSLRETQSILDLLGSKQLDPEFGDKLDHLAACLYKLTYRNRHR